MTLPEGHVCQCRSCGTFPHGPPQSYNHYAIRFKRGDEKRIRVLQDGVVLLRVTEVMAIPGGWAVSHSTDPPHMCQKCHQDVCETVLFGDFTVEDRPLEQTPPSFG